MPHDVITFGEAMIRLAPPIFRRLEQAHSLDVQIGGAELNTAVGLARLIEVAGHHLHLADSVEQRGHLSALLRRQSAIAHDKVLDQPALVIAADRQAVAAAQFAAFELMLAEHLHHVLGELANLIALAGDLVAQIEDGLAHLAEQIEQFVEPSSLDVERLAELLEALALVLGHCLPLGERQSAR